MTKRRVPHFDQGNLGSCTGNATSAMYSQVFGTTPRSRLEIYYEARRLIDTLSEDSGAYLRDCLKVLANIGAGSEAYWPYIEPKFADSPPKREYTDAAKHKVVNYSRLTTRADFHQCLVEGFPFVIGFTCYDFFESDLLAATGILPYPAKSESAIGGHAIMVVGYNKDFKNSQWAKDMVARGFPAAKVPADVYIVQNSWGNQWGMAGDFAVDAKYFENDNLADDAWTIRKAAA